MPASGSMSVSSAIPYIGPRRATAVCIAPMEQCHVHPYNCRHKARVRAAARNSSYFRILILTFGGLDVLVEGWF